MERLFEYDEVFFLLYSHFNSNQNENSINFFQNSFTMSVQSIDESFISLTYQKCQAQDMRLTSLADLVFDEIKHSKLMKDLHDLVKKYKTEIEGW